MDGADEVTFMELGLVADAAEKCCSLCAERAGCVAWDTYRQGPSSYLCQARSGGGSAGPNAERSMQGAQHEQHEHVLPLEPGAGSRCPGVCTRGQQSDATWHSDASQARCPRACPPCALPDCRLTQP